jgi:hypothetical protein
MKQNRTAGMSWFCTGHLPFCVKLPIRNRHHAGQNESDWMGEQADHDRDATKEF